MLLCGRLAPAGGNACGAIWVTAAGGAYLLSPAPKKLFVTLFSFTISSVAVKEWLWRGISEVRRVTDSVPDACPRSYRLKPCPDRDEGERFPAGLAAQK